MIASWIVRRMIRADLARVVRGDIDAALTKWDDDGIYDYPSNLSAGGTIQGKEAIADWHHRWFEEFPRRDIIVRNIAFGAWPLSPSNVVMVEWTCEETNKEGQEFKYDGVSVIHMRRYKCIKWSDHISFKGLPQISTLLASAGKTQDAPLTNDR